MQGVAGRFSGARQPIGAGVFAQEHIPAGKFVFELVGAQHGKGCCCPEGCASDGFERC